MRSNFDPAGQNREGTEATAEESKIIKILVSYLWLCMPQQACFGFLIKSIHWILFAAQYSVTLNL